MALLEGELRSKTQRKLKFSPLEILTNGFLEDRLIFIE